MSHITSSSSIAHFKEINTCYNQDIKYQDAYCRYSENSREKIKYTAKIHFLELYKEMFRTMYLILHAYSI